MTKCLNNVVLATTKVAIQKVSFILVNCDEITNMDNQSWISMHVDVVEDFKKTPIFVNFQHVTIGTNTNILIIFMKNFYVEFEGLSNHDMVVKVFEGGLFWCKWCIHFSRHQN
jgi:hypothetical protein